MATKLPSNNHPKPQKCCTDNISWNKVRNIATFLEPMRFVCISE